MKCPVGEYPHNLLTPIRLERIQDDGDFFIKFFIEKKVEFMKKRLYERTTQDSNVKHLHSKDVTQHKLLEKGGTKGSDRHLKKMKKHKNKKDFYT